MLRKVGFVFAAVAVTIVLSAVRLSAQGGPLDCGNCGDDYVGGNWVHKFGVPEGSELFCASLQGGHSTDCSGGYHVGGCFAFHGICTPAEEVDRLRSLLATEAWTEAAMLVQTAASIRAVPSVGGSVHLVFDTCSGEQFSIDAPMGLQRAIGTVERSSILAGTQ